MSGSDAFALRCLATRDEERKGWLLRGVKQWISNSKEAGLFIVFATVDPEKVGNLILLPGYEPPEPMVFIGDHTVCFLAVCTADDLRLFGELGELFHVESYSG